jgi:hypothetical protein
MEGKELLTASRMSAMLTCPRKHYWSYEIGLKAAEDAHALRFGSAWHTAMEARWKGAQPETCFNLALEGREFDEITAATLSGLLFAYCEHYNNDSGIIAEIHSEVQFETPIDGSRTFVAAGKLDGLAVLKDGRQALVEHKTAGVDIGADSDYWLRLRADSQILQYVKAARSLGWNISTVIYDVTRKPAIRQKKDETPEQFGERLTKDALERPDFYFARREVPVLDQDLEEFEYNRIQTSRMILDRRRQQKIQERPERAWPRHVNGLVCPFCQYRGFCLQNIGVDLQAPPAGFKIEKEIHPELKTKEKDGDK